MKPKSIRELLDEITLLFQKNHIEYPKEQAEYLLGDLLNYSRSILYQNENQILSEKESLQAKNWIQRRIEGEPLAYLAGQVDFYGNSFKINPFVLIPRPETEILIDKIVQQLKTQDLKNKVLWDICSGSGVIGVTLKKIFPCLSVFLSDCSAEALAISQSNADHLQVEVQCLKGDLLAPFKGQKAHYVVCNPPYISETEYAQLNKEVKNFEPYVALVGGETGLEIYERLASELPAYLYPQAQVWLEIGYTQGESLQKIFQKNWKKQKLENDWAGHNRFFFLENE